VKAGLETARLFVSPFVQLKQLFVGGLMSYLCYLCLFAYSGVQHFVPSYVFTFLVHCCDVRIKTMFGSSLPLIVDRRAHVLFMLFVFVSIYWCQHVLTVLRIVHS
jgi:hypothetical protein